MEEKINAETETGLYAEVSKQGKENKKHNNSDTEVNEMGLMYAEVDVNTLQIILSLKHFCNYQLISEKSL